MCKNSYNETMINYYNQRAPHHDDYMSFSNRETFEKRLKPILEIITPDFENKNILELACGTGNWTGTLAKLGNQVTALDSSEQSLAIAQEKLKSFKNIEYKLMDIYKLNKLNLKFDTIFAADWWSHIPKAEIKQFHENLNQLLNKNGVVIILDMTFKKYFQEEESVIDSNKNRIFIRTLPNGNKYEVIKNFPTRDELFSYLPNTFSRQYYPFDSLERWMFRYSPE